MSKPVISGKKPLSSKAAPGPIQAPDFFRDKFSIPAGLQKELEGKGLDWRFVSYKKYVDAGGQHDRGWTAYKTENKSDLPAFLLGHSPDGIIRRGDTLLVVRPKTYSEQHKQWLRQKAERQTGQTKAKARELREMAADVEAKIYEGYEENEE